MTFHPELREPELREPAPAVTPAPAPRAASMLRYAPAIFLSAFLLFMVQPLLASIILPWFGGSSGVWTTCLLFFQALLLGGYAYAHLLGRFSLRVQSRIHLVLVLGSLAFLPIIPSLGWQPTGAEAPIPRILGLLAATVGVPYLILASTGPLLQNWFSRDAGGAPPYRLFALSNAASLLGLVTYPFLVQPFLDVNPQAVGWSLAYGGFALAVGFCAPGLRRGPAAGAASGSGAARPGARGPSSPGPEITARITPPRAPARDERFFWWALPATASALLLGITNTLTTEVAPVPFLWVLPLALYLLTFILAFDHPRWTPRRVVAPLFVIALLANTFLLRLVLPDPSWMRQLLIASATLFLAGLVCHGELARLKPHPRHLTAFYLSVAAGGALGGLLVAVVAPVVFHDFWEVPLGLLVCLLLLLARVYTDPESRLSPARRPRAWLAVAIGVGLLGPALLGVPILNAMNQEQQVRNFYGVLQVDTREADTPLARRILKHGITIHGAQFLDPDRRDQPNTYYGWGSGAALAVTRHPVRRAGGALHAGVVGLGAGTLAAWGRSGDVFRFYELNPQVVHLARTAFTFLADSPASVDVVLGDGRLSLRREAARAPASLDLLVVDAFSGGSIPVHLLTRECFETYWRVLRPGGILAVHVSNEYLRLAPVVRGAAEALGKEAVLVHQAPDTSRAEESSDWVLVTGNATFLADPVVREAATPWTEEDSPILWTDRRASLLPVLR